MTTNPHIGSSLDDFLAENGILEETKTLALKQMIADEISNAMEEKRLSQTDVAKAMGTSRSSVKRLLDPNNHSLRLDTLEKAASVVGKQVEIKLVEKAN